MAVTEKQRVKQLFKEWGKLFEPITTPIVYHPGGWEDTVPEELKSEVLRQRLEKLNNGGWTEATDAEVLCYLYTASLDQPLTRDWTEIYLYQTSQWRPELRDTGIDVPKELTDYQKSELRNLKRNIRDSQIRRRKNTRKEASMSNRKLVMEEHEGKVLVGIQQEGCDPVVKTVDGDLFAALESANALIAEATEKWATSPKNPTYKPPAEPKKATKPAAAPAPTAQKAEDLPLLAGKDKPKEAAPAETEQPAEPAEQPVTAPAAEEKQAEEGTEKAEPQAPATEAEPAAEITPAEPTPTPEPEKEEVSLATGEYETKSGTSQAPHPSVVLTGGQVEYWLEDGRGPYPDIQKAMDEMGMDKDNRPHHNRWDRLSAALKQKIQRKPKA